MSIDAERTSFDLHDQTTTSCKVPAEFDCAWRRWAFARLRGGQAGVRTFSTDAAAFDGLQIATKCNDSYPGDLLPPFPRHHGALGRSDGAARWCVDAITQRHSHVLPEKRTRLSNPLPHHTSHSHWHAHALACHSTLCRFPGT